MVLKLYCAPVLGVRSSGAIVALVLAEKQIPFENVPIEFLEMEHKSPEHLARHPFGQVPVIDDDGFVLYESHAICRYLAEKYPEKGPKLVPGPDASLQERALFEQASSVERANFSGIAGLLQTETFIKPRSGLPVDHAAVERALVQLGAKLDVYEQILSKQKYIGGDEVSLVDLFHLAPMTALLGDGSVDVDVMVGERRPNVARWWNALSTRPGWVRLQERGIQSLA
ncbi:hypothetical protein HMN09_01298200 [Mycena chlorophos]|uniref:glutathione transferase n=1 Tax=Mycena chlorophos TaxID=658473 RepID=A0A8H6VQK8_MYCCL|nr:hypothetical protein HMN09_01298200 [Mycena chlorophos]